MISTGATSLHTTPLGEDSFMTASWIQKEYRPTKRMTKADYMKMDPAVRACKNNWRRAVKAGNETYTTWQEKALIIALYRAAAILTKTCGEEIQVDHISPINSGGPHTWNNLQLLTKKENRQKSFKVSDDGGH